MIIKIDYTNNKEDIFFLSYKEDNNLYYIEEYLARTILNTKRIYIKNNNGGFNIT